MANHKNTFSCNLIWNVVTFDMGISK